MDKKQVEKVALLARLKLSETEKDNISSQLSSILGYVDHLSELDTQQIEPMGQPFVKELPMAEDILDEFDDIKSLTDQAPEFQEGFYRVKKIIE